MNHLYTVYCIEKNNWIQQKKIKIIINPTL